MKLIEGMTVEFDPAKYHDTYSEDVKKLKRLELRQADQSSPEIDGKSPVIEGGGGGRVGGPATELFGSVAILD
jgi:hypothetical protein